MAFVALARSSGGSLLKIKISAILQKARIKIVAHAIYLYLFFLINIKSKGLFFNVLMSLLISLLKISLKFIKSLTRYEFLSPRFWNFCLFFGFPYLGFTSLPFLTLSNIKFHISFFSISIYEALVHVISLHQHQLWSTTYTNHGRTWIQVHQWGV